MSLVSPFLFYHTFLVARFASNPIVESVPHAGTWSSLGVVDAPNKLASIGGMDL